MTNAELKEALRSKRPIIAKIINIGEVFYKCVEEVKYRWGGTYEKGHIVCSAVLLDKNGKSSTTILARYLRYATEEEIKKSTADATNINCGK